MRSFVLEICLDSVESAVIAEKAGADRVELCADLTAGGTTPSIGAIALAKKRLTIPVHVIIRPRGGDFCYSATEFEVMRSDVLSAKSAGADGVVLGILNPDGTVDIARTRILVELARPLSVTFHRAFDMTNDPFQALQDVILTGADRILSSGQAETAFEGLPLLVRLVEQASERIIIMPGAGINAANAKSILKAAPFKEMHMSAKKTLKSRMEFRPLRLSMGDGTAQAEFEISSIDTDKIKAIVEMEI